MKLSDFIVLVDTKARMNLKAEASKLYLSFLWWIIEPILFVLAFYFVFGILLKTGRADFLLFLMCAKIPYMWFSKAVSSAAGSIAGSRGIIAQVDIPKTIFPYATIQVTAYKEIPVMLMLMGLCMIYGYMPGWDWLWLIPLIFVLYLLIVLFSLIFALLVCYADDVRMLISMLMLFLMFVSGIFFDITDISQPMQGYLMIFNPLTFVCDSYRKVLMHKGSYSMVHLWWLIAFCLTGIAIMHFVYRKLSRSIASRVVNA
jgi:lipopolysaccharide transport system permease protein